MLIERIVIYVYLCHAKTVTRALLQVAVVDDVTFLIVQISQKFILTLVGRFVARRTEW